MKKQEITLEQKSFIKHNCHRLSDTTISLRLNMSYSVVKKYRQSVLGYIKKNKTLAKYKTAIDQRRTAAKELYALEQFEYNGIMKDSFEQRKEFLKVILEC